MKLKVQGVELIYGCYVHSAILCTFHRRCYWLLLHPEIVLVHYLNVSQCADSRAQLSQLSFNGRALSIASKGLDWGREQLIRELKPMCTYCHMKRTNYYSLRNRSVDALAVSLEWKIINLIANLKMNFFNFFLKQKIFSLSNPS